jgi:hypothetical protein
MLGLIPKVLLELVASSAGAEAVAEVRRRAAVSPDKHFGLGELYDDAEWQRIFNAVCEVLNISPAQAEQQFADHFLADALKRWPGWFEISSNARELMERQPIIHNSLATSVHDRQARNSINDKFLVQKHEGGLITRYRSPNRLCGLYMALVRRLLTHYGESATVEETQCMKQGATECVILTRWTSQENPP